MSTSEQKIQAPADMATRIHHATVAAQEAFWESMVASFPEIKTGDFPPEADLRFDQACISATTTWIDANRPRRVARTSDGYSFTEEPDGSWTDGDMTFESLAQLLEEDPDLLIDGKPVPQSSNPENPERG